MLRTSSQRANLCRSCPTAKAADLIGDTCSLIIIRDLLKAPMRFSEISRSLDGVSSRTLTLKLKNLTAQSLLSHKDDRYALTAKGRALRPVIESLRRYGERHL